MLGVIPNLPGMCPVGPHLVGEAYPDVVRQSVSRSHHKLKTLQIPRIMDLVCSITVLILSYNFTINATPIPKLDNGIADSLSRFQMDRFRALTPQPPSLLASSLHQRRSFDSLCTATFPCLFCPLQKANLQGRSETFLNLQPYAWIGGTL